MSEWRQKSVIWLRIWSFFIGREFDPVMVGGEAVRDAPQHCLGTAADVDLAVDRADVGLDRVRAQERQPCDIRVALSLGDQGEDLRFAVGQTLAAAGPVQTGRAARPARRLVTDHHFPRMDRLQRRNQIARRQRLGQIPVHPLPAGAGDQVRMEVPRVDHHPAGARIRHQRADLFLVGLRLGEGVVQHDVDDAVHRLVRVQLADDHPVAVPVEHVRHAGHDDVVVVHEGDRDG
jgi:hypothetical protein